MLSETVKSWPSQWMEKGKVDGKIEGKVEGKIEDALNMLKDEVPVEKICQYTGLAREKVLELANKKSPPDKVIEPTAGYGKPSRRKHTRHTRQARPPETA